MSPYIHFQCTYILLLPNSHVLMQFVFTHYWGLNDIKHLEILINKYLNLESYMIFASYKLAYFKYLIDTLERIEQTNLMLDEKSFSLGTMNSLLFL